MAADGTISGTPAAGTGGVHEFEVTVSNGIAPTEARPGTGALAIVVEEKPAVTSPAQTTTPYVAYAGKPFELQFEASGFPAAAWSIEARQGYILPEWLAIDAETGLASGTPGSEDVGKRFGGWFRATNRAGYGQIFALFNVRAFVAPAVAEAQLAPGVVGEAYEAQVAVSGDPVPEVEVTGLPDGLTAAFDAATMTVSISGTPTAIGTSQVTVTAVNGFGDFDSETFDLVVDKEHHAPAIDDITKLPSALVGEAYAQSIQVAGYPVPSVEVEGLPEGLSWTFDGYSAESERGVLTIAGTPAEVWQGQITISASNDAGSDSRSVDLRVVDELVAPQVLTASPLESARVGKPYSLRLAVEGVPDPVVTVSGLPAGLALDEDNRTIVGTPDAGTVGQTFDVVISAVNEMGTDTVTSKLTVTQAPAIVTAAQLPGGKENVAYEVQLEASGFPASTWSLVTGSSLPAGLALDPATGTISGTPAEGSAGSNEFAIKADNGAGSEIRTFTLAIEKTDIAAAILTEELPAVQALAPCELAIQVAARPEPTVTLTGLPEGLAYETAYDFEAGVATVSITGTPQKAGSYELAVAVTGDAGITDGSLVLDVKCAPIEGAVVTLAQQSAPYTGKAQAGAVESVRLGAWPLFAGTDYEVSVVSGVDAGSYRVLVIGIGNYTGTVETQFEIVPAQITAVTAKNQTYTGKALKPVPTVKAGSLTVPAAGYTATYSKNTNAGTATVKVTGKGNYAGTASTTFAIAPANIAKATIEKVPDQRAAMKAITPTPKVTLDGRTLKLGTDYTLSYKNNVLPGTATITVTGKANYTGTATSQFLIKEVDLELTRVAGENRLVTMAEIAKTAFTGTSDWAIVAQAVDFPDALGAAALAGAYKAPVLTTVSKELSAEARDQLKRLKVKNVLVLGGPGSVSDNAVRQIKAIPGVKSVKRVAGANRFGTSLEAYKQFQSKASGYDTVVVASGASFADALTAGPYCYARNAAMVLGWNKGLEDYLVKAIKADKNVKKVVIVSSAGAVDVAKVKAQLGSSYKYATITGSNTYATNKAFNTWALANGMTAEKPVIATGEAFADALAGAPLAGVNNSVMVLVKNSKSASLGAITTAKVKPTIEHAYMLGAAATIDVANAKAIAKTFGLTYIPHRLDSPSAMKR